MHSTMHQHHHTLSTNQIFSHMNRNVPSYYVTSEDSMAPGNRDSLSPRYSQTFHQPWRRQNSSSSLSFIPHRPEQSEYTTSHRRPADCGPVCISPFRSVRRMKQPFQLVLPTSPSIDSSPSLGKESRASRPSSGNHTLRTWRSEGNLKTSGEIFGLWPSPSLPDSPVSHPSPAPSSAYFSPKPDSESEKDTEVTKNCECEPELNSCGTCKEPEAESQEQEQNKAEDITNVHLANSTLIKQCDSDEDQAAPPIPGTGIMESPVIPSAHDLPRKNTNPFTNPARAQRPRAGTVSSDTSWIPSNFSYCEDWLQNVPFETTNVRSEKSKEANRRKVIVAPPGQKIDDQDDSNIELGSNIDPGSTIDSESNIGRDSNIGHESNISSDNNTASNLENQSFDEKDQPVAQTAKAKPPDVRLAVASRPLAVTTKPKLVDISSRQSSPAMSYTLPTPHHAVPSTPDQRQQEVSAFSPDTPLDMSDSGYATNHSFDSPGDFHDDKVDNESTDSASLSTESMSSTVVCDKPSITPDPPPYSPPKFSNQARLSQITKPQVPPSSPSNSSMSEKEQLQKWWDHEWTIDQLEQSAKDFPRHMLRLTSPVIMFLRKNNEKALIRPFRKIFPEVAENLLDGLCASLIARNYIVSLVASNRTNPGHFHKPIPPRLDSIPGKASTFGIQFAQASPNQIKERVLGSRSVELRQDLDQTVENLLFAICGRPDETLKSAVLVLAEVLEAKSA